MDPRSMAPEVSYLAFLYSNMAKAIKDVTAKYSAASAAPAIGAECLAINATLNDIQFLLSLPHSMSSQVMSQSQLHNILKNVYNDCNINLLKLEDEVGKHSRNQAALGENGSAPGLTQPCDEGLIKTLLQQIRRQVTDASVLIAAVQKTSGSDARQVLNKDTFIAEPADLYDQVPSPTSIKPSGYSQSVSDHLDVDSKSICTRASDNISHMSFRSGPSEPSSPLPRDAQLVTSNLPAVPPIPEKAKKVSRSQVGSIFFKLFKSNTELHRAAKKGDAKKIKSLLALGVDINYEGSSGCTALHLATDCGHEAVVRMLLSHGADPAAKSSEGRTPLHSAARIGNPAVVRLLLEKVVDVHARDPSGSTALHIAAFNGQESVVQILLEKHPWLEVRGGSGFTALHVAAFNGQSAVVRQLVEMAADLEARSDTGRTALQLAAERGHEAVVRYLLQHGANIMAKDSLGRTALQGAVSNQHGVVAQLLLDKAVIPEGGASRWSHHSGSRSGTTHELGGGDHSFKMPTHLPPGWSQQAYNGPIYELSDGSTAVELPAGDINGEKKVQTSMPQRMDLPSHLRVDYT